MISITRKGFGLLEALIASGIIIMIATASIGLANVIVKSTTNFNQIIVADNLASEAIEVAHQMRDYYLNDGDPETDWSQGFQKDGTGIKNLGCKAYASAKGDDTEKSCYIDQEDALSYDIGTKFTFNDGNSLKQVTVGELDQTMSFQRKIYIDKIPDKDAYEMRVIVRRAGETENLADVSTTLTNWK